MSDEGAPSGGSRTATAYARLVVALRWPILIAWVAATGYVVLEVPEPAAGPSDLISLVPKHAPALTATRRAAEAFDVPFSAEVSVVERDPRGLSVQEQRRAVNQALAIDRPSGGGDPPFLVLPVTNTAGAVPGSRESSTGVISYFTFPPAMSVEGRMQAVRHYMADARRAGAPVVGRTGILPAQLHEGTLVEDALPYVEAATVIMVALVVGLMFRSLGAPLVTLATVGAAYLMALRATDRLSDATGLTLPDILKPLMVALVLGIVTDYTIFYASTMRRLVTSGVPRVEAARRATAMITPIVLAGGVILAASLAALQVAQLSFFRAVGPGLAAAVLVALAAAMTLVPAALAIFGRALFWPSLSPGDDGSEERGIAGLRARVARVQARRFAGLVMVAVCLAVLAVAAWQVPNMQLGFTSIHGLPSDAQERRAANAVGRAFAPGMLAPTQILVEGSGVGDDAALARLQAAIRRQPGVAAVVGPAEQLAGSDVAAFRQGDAARYIVAFDSDPHGAAAIDDVSRLRDRLPGLARSAGLASAHISVAGDTALADDTISAMETDLMKVAAVVLVLNFILLAAFLRALVAPVLLVLSSALSVAAAMGITAWVFQTWLGHGEITYYVPFAASVLLVSLGSDYNVFITGLVWQEARGRPVREALARVAPRAAGAIRTAGITLALSFGMLAIIQVRAFWEFAFAMATGILLETFVVRPLLVPALVALFGEAAGWPGNRLQEPEPASAHGD
ncbi:MAG TPA: MMPL family transporter [Gaiellales bacterium]|nr:MMPL family transporter [Gaiellales bacterium]